MTTKKKQNTEAASKPKNVVQVYQQSGETNDAATSRTLTQPEMLAALSIQQWQGDITEVNALAKTLASQIDDVNNGSMNRPEAMLVAQAHTLDALFNSLARRTHLQENIKNYETYLRLALKAQSQCRTTIIETLAAIKNPPVIFAKQANFANNQQVNNGSLAPATHAGENKSLQNGLLEVNDGERLDTGTTSETITENKAMASMD